VAGVEIRLEHLPGAVDELAQRAGTIKQLAVGGHPPRADILERGHQKVGHRAEVVEDQRLVASGLGGDPPGAGGGESRLAQRGDGRRDERGTRVPHQPTLPWQILSDRFKRSLKSYACQRRARTRWAHGEEYWWRRRHSGDAEDELRRRKVESVLDGTSIGAVEHSQTVEATIDSGRHVLRIRSGRYSSHNRTFDAADGEAAGDRCHGAMVWPRWVASFVKPDLAIALIRQ
jgi:hypothetical protein